MITLYEEKKSEIITGSPIPSLLKQWINRLLEDYVNNSCNFSIFRPPISMDVKLKNSMKMIDIYFFVEYLEKREVALKHVIFWCHWPITSQADILQSIGFFQTFPRRAANNW